MLLSGLFGEEQIPDWNAYRPSLRTDHQSEPEVLGLCMLQAVTVHTISKFVNALALSLTTVALGLGIVGPTSTWPRPTDVG